jgi:hypothetical protein
MGGRSSGVELQPSKLAVASSNLVARSKPSLFDAMDSGAHVAQLAEHVLGKDEVTRSIRVVGSIPSLLDPECCRPVAFGRATGALARRDNATSALDFGRV